MPTITNIDFAIPQSFTDYHGIVQTFEPFAQRGIYVTPSRDAILRARIQSNKCFFCGDELRAVHLQQYQDWDAIVTERVSACGSCGNWKGTANTSVSVDEYVLPFVRDFDPHRQVPALTALLEEVQKNPKTVFSTSPKQFELLVGTVLKSYFECDVELVGKSRDGGVDLIVVHADDPIMVQVKRRLNEEAVEGIDVVKLLFASMYGRNASKGMVVTTGQRFSKDARDWVHLPALVDNGFELDLIDLDRLLSMTNRLENSDGPQWESAVHFWRSPGAGYMINKLLLDRKQPEGVTRLLDGHLIRLPDGAQDGCLIFSDTLRDRCWRCSAIVWSILTSNKQIAQTPIANIVLEYETVQEEGDIFRALLGTPSEIVDRVVETWTANKTESAVDWLF